MSDEERTLISVHNSMLKRLHVYQNVVVNCTMPSSLISSVSSWLASPAISSRSRLLENDKSAQELQHKLVNYLWDVNKSWLCYQRGAAEDHMRQGANWPSRRGHLLCALESTIPQAGTGVFLKRGTIHPGDIVTLYPGLVYSAQHFLDLMAGAAPADDAYAPEVPAFTVDNHFLLRQPTNLHQDIFVDGKPDGVSAQLFAASALEASLRNTPVNTAWLRLKEILHHNKHSQPGETNQRSGAADSHPSVNRVRLSALQLVQQQAAMGHLVNHPPPDQPSNVEFQVCALPSNIPNHLLRFIPTLPYQPGLVQHPSAAGWLLGRNRKESPADAGTRWAIVLRAAGRMSACEEGGNKGVELFVDYGTDPLNLGYSP